MFVGANNGAVLGSAPWIVAVEDAGLAASEDTIVSAGADVAHASRIPAR
jgi:hypothetical protein